LLINPKLSPGRRKGSPPEQPSDDSARPVWASSSSSSRGGRPGLPRPSDEHRPAGPRNLTSLVRPSLAPRASARRLMRAEEGADEDQGTARESFLPIASLSSPDPATDACQTRRHRATRIPRLRRSAPGGKRDQHTADRPPSERAAWGRIATRWAGALAGSPLILIGTFSARINLRALARGASDGRTRLVKFRGPAVDVRQMALGGPAARPRDEEEELAHTGRAESSEGCSGGDPFLRPGESLG